MYLPMLDYIFHKEGFNHVKGIYFQKDNIHSNIINKFILLNTHHKNLYFLSHIENHFIRNIHLYIQCIDINYYSIKKFRNLKLYLNILNHLMKLNNFHYKFHIYHRRINMFNNFKYFKTSFLSHILNPMKKILINIFYMKKMIIYHHIPHKIQFNSHFYIHLMNINNMYFHILNNFHSLHKFYNF